MVLNICLCVLLILLFIYYIIRNKKKESEVLIECCLEKNIINVKQIDLSNVIKTLNNNIGEKVILYLSTLDIYAEGTIKSVNKEYLRIVDAKTKDEKDFLYSNIDFIELGQNLSIPSPNNEKKESE